MADIISWNNLDTCMGETLYEETYLKSEIKRCKPVEILDITHIKFQYLYDDDEQEYGYPVQVKYTPDIRYWDEYPSPDERKNRNWR